MLIEKKGIEDISNFQLLNKLFNNLNCYCSSGTLDEINRLKHLSELSILFFSLKNISLRLV